MTEKQFHESKEELIDKVNNQLESAISLPEKESMATLLKILHEYNYNERLKFKGLLSRTIIDSLTLDYSFGENFIVFDQQIK